MTIPKCFRCPRCKTGQLGMGATAIWCHKCEEKAYEFIGNSIVQTGYQTPIYVDDFPHRVQPVEPVTAESKSPPIKAREQAKLELV